MEIILIANEKGGTAKSATCLCLANCLTALGYRVMVTDTDPSGNLSAAALEEFPDHVLYDVFTEACELEDAIYQTPFGAILPSIKDLSSASESKKSFVFKSRKNLGELFASAYGDDNAEQFLRNLLRQEELEKNYDFNIIDSAPAANLLITNAVVAADSVIIPVEPNSASSDGFLMFLKSIQEAAHKYNAQIHVDGLVFTKFSDNWQTRRKQIDEISFLARNREIYIYRNKFRTSASIETSMNECKPILDYINKRDNGVYDAMNFALEFLARRGLAPRVTFPGVIQDEENAWIYRKNGNKYYTYTMIGDKAQLESRRLKKGDLEDPAFMDTIGKTVFFDVMNLEAHLISQKIRYIPEGESSES